MSVGRIALTLAALITVGWSSRPFAQELVPQGPQFLVNTYTTDSQQAPAVAADDAGNFVVVWASTGSGGSDASGISIQGQRYESDGTPQGVQFQVNTHTTGDQGSPAVAADGAGNFLVVWQGATGGGGSDTSDGSVQGQRYDGVGTPQGGEFQVNSYTTGPQQTPAVATDGDGNVLVAWQSAGSTGSDTSGGSIQAQRYHSTGVPQSGEFQVNSYTTGRQYAPAVAGDDAGNFVVVWTSAGSAGSDTSAYGIQGQRYDDAGTPQGAQFQVNTYTTVDQRFPAVTIDGAGNFVVVWTSTGSGGSDTSGSSIQGQRYDSAGTPQGAEFQVNTHTTGNQESPAVAAEGGGTFVVVWQSYGGAGSDTDNTGIFGQRYDAAGTPQGGEFQVNTYTTGFQQAPAVAADAAGRFVVVWQSAADGSDTSGFSVQAQRFTVPTTTSTTSTTLPVTGLLPGRIAVIKPGTLASFVAKPAGGNTFTLPSSDPVAVGGSLRVSDLGTTAGTDTYLLRAGAAWRGLGKPAGSKGYRYAGAGTPGDPCETVLVKARLIKAVCRGTGVTLTPPFTGDIGIALTFGTTDRYCAQFGGKSVKNDAKLTKRKKAPAPGACAP
jgi:hypothetical protein